MTNWRLAEAATPDVILQDEVTSAASVQFDGLKPGTVYVITARAHSSAGYSGWTDPVTIMAVRKNE